MCQVPTYDGGCRALSNILAELSQWASTLQYWEQAALEKILSGSELTDDDYDNLLQYLLEDSNLEEPKSARPVLQFPKGLSQEGWISQRGYQINKNMQLA